MTSAGLLVAALLASGCAHRSATAPGPDARPDAHRAMLTLDTHLDTPVHFARTGWSFGGRHDPATDLAQVDLPRMADGALAGGFFVIFTPQGPLTTAGYADAKRFALERSDLIDRTLARFPDRIEPARNAADVRRLGASGKLVALKSIENSYPLGEDLSLLAEFRRRGVRLAGPVHSSTNQFADSSTGDARWKGLSPLGRRWVAEMNRQGLVIDPSHASDAAFDRMLELSRTPLLLSHTAPRAAFDHPRNLDDARIRRLVAKGGAVCMTSIYLSPIGMGSERAGLFEEQERIGAMPLARQADLAKRWRALDRTAPLWSANFEDYMRALVHLIEVAGVDGVCFGADWDGGGGIAGLEEVSASPRITARLLELGYKPADIEKMWSGNVLRILGQAERAAAPGG